MKRSNKMALKSLFLCALISQNILANESSAYSFGGACSSQGLWTQSALSTTQTLRQVITKLKDNPNCQALGQSVQNSIAQLENTISSAQTSPQKESRLTQLPQEISALRSYSLSSKEDKSSILRMIMDRSIEQATLTAQVDQLNGTIAGRISDLGTRVERSARSGLGILNNVIDTIPQMDECLDGDQNLILGNVFSASVQIASSFASSGQDLTGSQLATTISKLTSLARNRKYSMALRELNKQEFKASMACLMEITSESYCSARDQMSLFQSAMKELKNKSNKHTAINQENPFAGFYILNTHVPNVTKFLQKIQIGVDPKLPTDAIFQNNIQQQVTDFYKNVKSMLGVYNQSLSNVKSLKENEAKKNEVLNLVIKISNEMIDERGFGNDQVKNFFTTANQEIAIPFLLLGINEVPAQVRGENGVFPMPGVDWLKANRDKIPGLNNPNELIEVIGMNMNKIIRSANIAAIDYYNQWYIVDKSALVNESMTNINYTVEDSLKAINTFLTISKNRIEKLNGNRSSVSNIIDTQAKISKILDAYKKLNEIGKKLEGKENVRLTEEELSQNAIAHEKLISTIYEQFNVMLSRSGFLANRMINFVYNDYILLMKNNIHFTKSQQDLFTAQGMAALDKMLQSYNGNPANVKTDLNMALSINLGNLDALEHVIKPSLIGTMRELDETISGKRRGFFSRYFQSIRDNANQFKDNGDDLGGMLVMGDSKFSFSNIYYFMKNYDSYKASNNSNPRVQSEFSDASNLMAQLCIQTLAFKGQAQIKELCEGRILKSPFEDESNLDVSYDEVLDRHLNDVNLDHSLKRALNNSERVCAFRDYNRKNMVRYMQQNQDSQDQ